MARRTIRVEGDPVLTKKSRPVEEMTPKISELITDMLDTMYDAMGVGLAAPQVGILEPGDYVMVHAGVAIAKITDDDEEETDQLMEELL